MDQKNKKIFYELNPRYFKDNSNDGIGDLQGLASKFDYFDFLKVDALIIQDLLSTDVQCADQSFTKIAPELGIIDDFIKVVSKANKYGIKIYIELKIGYVTKNNAWFNMIEEGKVEEFKNLVEFSTQAINLDNELKYVKSEVNNEYYVFDARTQEIPLNWQSDHIIEKFMSVIKFWKELGVSGFVFKDFEFISNKEKSEVMSMATVSELKKFMAALREYDSSIEIIGKSSLISLVDSSRYVDGDEKIFDYFMSQNISLIGTDAKFLIDRVGKFKPKHLGKSIKLISKSNQVLSFGSRLSGRILSRWGNENVYSIESAKSLAMLLLFSNTPSSIYYADELGTPNIGLNHLSDFQDRFIEQRWEFAKSNGVLEHDFREAQVMQNPINSRSLMAWNEELNGGFSAYQSPITPVSNTYKINNVTREFGDEHSVLNFYKKLIDILKDEKISKVINGGKFTVYTLVSGLVVYVYKLDKTELKIVVNLSDRTRAICPRTKNWTLLATTYINKEYKVIPRKLEAFEGLILINTIKDFKDSATILSKEDKIDIDKVEENEGISNTEIIQSAFDDEENNTLISDFTANKDTTEDSRKEEDMWFKRKQKENKTQELKVEVNEQLPAVVEHHPDVHIEAIVHPEETSEIRKSTLEIEKEKAIAEREADRSHKDEQTKLTEDQLAKTTLIDDSMDMEDLFKHEISKKKG